MNLSFGREVAAIFRGHVKDLCSVVLLLQCKILKTSKLRVSKGKGKWKALQTVEDATEPGEALKRIF